MKNPDEYSFRTTDLFGKTQFRWIMKTFRIASLLWGNIWVMVDSPHKGPVIWKAFPCHAVSHDDVIKWKHFPRYWPFVRGIHRSPVNSPHKGQWRGALMFSLICAWINGWVNNRETGDWSLWRHSNAWKINLWLLKWTHADNRKWHDATEVVVTTNQL